MFGKLNAQSVAMQMKSKDLVLLVLSKNEYSENILELSKIVSKQSKGVCYVSVNKPAKSIAQVFSAAGIDTKNFRFIDCVSRSAFDNNIKKEGADKTVYISSPGNFTEISINVASCMSNGFDTVFVDALSTFLVYGDSNTVIRFAHSLITKVREFGGKGFFVVLKDDVSNALLNDLSMFVDGVVET